MRGNGEQIFNVNNLTVEDRTTNKPNAIDRCWLLLRFERAMMSCQLGSVTLDEPDRCIIGTTHLGGTFCNRIQHRLDIGR